MKFHLSSFAAAVFEYIMFPYYVIFANSFLEPVLVDCESQLCGLDFPVNDL